MIRKVTLGLVATEIKSSTTERIADMPIVGLEHLDPEELLLMRWDTSTKTTFTKTFKMGDVLFGRRRAYLKKAVIAPFDGICSSDITVIRAIPGKIFPELLPFIIQNDEFFTYAVKNSDGSLSPRAKWSSLKEYSFYLDDDLKKQRELARLLAACHESKIAYSRVLLKCDELIKSRFVEMFGEIDHVIAGFPRHRWKDVVTIISGKDHKLISGAGEYAVYGTGGRMGYATQFLCDKNTLIMGRKGTIDKPYLAPEKCWIVDTAFGVVPNPSLVTPCYLYYYAMQLDYDKLNKSTTLPSTTKKDLYNLWINVPPIILQRAFQGFVVSIDKLKFNLQQSIEKAKKLSSRILNDALSGNK